MKPTARYTITADHPTPGTNQIIVAFSRESVDYVKRLMEQLGFINICVTEELIGP